MSKNRKTADSSEDLFSAAELGKNGEKQNISSASTDSFTDNTDLTTRPLAVRLRPRTLDEVIGQRAALVPGSPLRRLAMPTSMTHLTAPSSLILFGPPGVGKTTLATIVSAQSGRAFEELSAASSGVKDVRAVLQRAWNRLIHEHQETVLFVDEVHHFSKSQQDALLPAVENRDVTFVASTTENPSFSVISPLLSRSVVVKLEPLSENDIRAILERALADRRGLDRHFALESAAEDAIVRISGGDARKALTILEAAASASSLTAANAAGFTRAVSDTSLPTLPISVKDVDAVMDSTLVRYDKTGDEHYDVASAFIKSLRGSDVDASLHYLARMIRAGEDPRFIARRLMIAAAEEVGMANPQVLQTAVAAAQAVDMIGMPEARIILSEAVIAVATAPKSNASYLAIDAALEDVDSGDIGSVPLHLRNAPTVLMKQWKNHEGYKYAHDFPGEIVAQEYMPEPLRGHEYYHPSSRGYEAVIAQELPHIRRILHSSAEQNTNGNGNINNGKVRTAAKKIHRAS
ncbi:MAG: replication-associated recombination protein A [Aeriscardovia sp.]|nr:replication-associated recombination protein A [Aeriscardovia sp.]